jgi:5-methylcytosine-specific restriction endonuclease McrA
MAELGYTKSSAQRRIDSMRVLKHVPEVEGKLAEGSLSLSHLSEAQTFFRKEEIRSPEEKKVILDQLVGKSVMEAQRTLMTLTDQPEQHIPERARVVTAELTEIRFVVDLKTLSEIEELKALLSHASPGMGVKEILQYGLKLALNKHRVKAPKEVAPTKEAKAERSNVSESDQITLVPTSVLGTVPASREVIPVQTRRHVYHRDNGCCTYVDAVSKRRCGSRRFLELDHIVPHALGGSNTAENLRLRCRSHNTLSAIGTFGHAQMARYVPALR